MATFRNAALASLVMLQSLHAVSAVDCEVDRCPAELEGGSDEVSQLQVNKAGPSVTEAVVSAQTPAEASLDDFQLAPEESLLAPDMASELARVLPQIFPNHSEEVESEACFLPNDCSPKLYKNVDHFNVYPPKDKETQCLDGSDYYFTVRAGKSKKLHIHFEGGGSCWDPLSYNLVFPFHSGADGHLCYQSVSELNYTSGMMDRSNPDNPWKDHSFIIINYCSGDMHGGHADRSWNLQIRPLRMSPVKIRGVDNAWSAIKYGQENFPELDQLTVSGSSAGSLGVQMWSNKVLDLFSRRSQDIVVIGDSFVGVIYPPGQQLTAEAKLMRKWDLCQPSVLTKGQVRLCKEGKLLMADMWSQAMKSYPKVKFVSLNSKGDIGQILFEKAFEATSGTLRGLLMTEYEYYKFASLQLKEWYKKHSNFHVFQVDGEQHVFLEEYVATATPLGPTGPSGPLGITMNKWLGSLVNGHAEASPRTVCEGEAVRLTIFTHPPKNITYCAESLTDLDWHAAKSQGI